MKTVTPFPPSAPPKVLIKEAREHRRRRYVRTAVVVALSSLLVAALVVGAVLFSGGPVAQGKTHDLPAPPPSAASAGVVYFRPVLCFAPPYDPAAPSPAASSTPSCSAASTLSAATLDARPDGAPGGFESNSVQPDQALAGVPSTGPSGVVPSATVLLPGLGVSRHQTGSGSIRYVLGPAEMSSSAIGSAAAQKNDLGQWLVRYRTTAEGAALWDRTAEENFHQFVAIELDGVVYSAPIIQPTQTSFSTFDGNGEVSGNLTAAEAQRLASALRPHTR